MNLAQRHQGPGLAAVRSNLPEKGSTIMLDGEFGVAFLETEIERFPAVYTGVTALTGRKAVDQPGEFPQLAGVKNSQLGFCRGPSWHPAILAEKGGRPEGALPEIRREVDLVFVVLEADFELVDGFVDGADRFDAVTAEIVRGVLQVLF